MSFKIIRLIFMILLLPIAFPFLLISAFIMEDNWYGFFDYWKDYFWGDDYI